MTAINFSNFSKNLLVIGSIYDKIDHVVPHNEWFLEHELIIFNGNLCYPNNDLDQVRDRIRKMNFYLDNGKTIYNLGDQDLILMKRLWETNTAPDILSWLKTKSNLIIIEFISQMKLLICNGGILPAMPRLALQDNLELSFVSKVGGNPWHEHYDGAAGYVIANNPLTKTAPIFYNYSIQMGNVFEEDNKVYAVQAKPHGLGRIFSL